MKVGVIMGSVSDYEVMADAVTMLEQLGIDFDSQTPDSNLTPKELEHKNRLRERIKKANQVRLQNIKSASTDRLINPS